MSSTTRPKPSQPQRLLTIGTVCRRLTPEFPEISISKIRYLEDQGLLTPRRTQGGYRLFGEEDVERLRTILRLQRDEFLPLRVIRQELASPSSKERRSRRAEGLSAAEEEVDAGTLRERAGVTAEQARELEDFGLLTPRSEGGTKLHGETDVEIALACGKLARFGIGPRHLRAFRTAVDREVGLLETVVAPGLRSRNPDRRSAALEDLQTLAGLAQELSQLLFSRELRKRVPS